jgi:putative acyl-CoA dehydrogenase
MNLSQLRFVKVRPQHILCLCYLFLSRLTRWRSITLKLLSTIQTQTLITPIFKRTIRFENTMFNPARHYRRWLSTTRWPSPHATHAVLNQSELWSGNSYVGDVALKSAVTHFTPHESWPQAQDHLLSTGEWAGSEEAAKLARIANTSGPILRQFDRNGRRIDVVDFVPAYHELMRRGIEVTQTPSYAWRLGAGGHVTRAALSMLTYGAESGTSCPLTMTFASVPALGMRGGADLRAWADGAQQPHYDPRDVPQSEKQGLTLGMSMTEKTGGSDVRSNTTYAVALPSTLAGGAEATFALHGHKWFTSAPMCDGFLTLAYGRAGAASDKSDSSLSCFLVPRWLRDGSRNTGFRIMRLKEKL